MLLSFYLLIYYIFNKVFIMFTFNVLRFLWKEEDDNDYDE